MPTIESIAIIRHKNTKISSDYTYRPYRVFTALTWLKKNNHLYESIELDWPNNVLDWQNQDSVVEPPYIELTDEEEREINEQNNDDPDLDERPPMAPSDKYENRTIEVIQDAIMDDTITAWEHRILQVTNTITT